MKYPASLVACLTICAVLLGYRSHYTDKGSPGKPLMLTQWDAFGYYLYLPATIIYHDFKKLDWATAVDQKYNVTGGDGMPVQHLENGNKACKYFGGVALLQLPLFTIAHLWAKSTGSPADGFSPPYQYALGYGLLLYCFLGIFLLRHILLRYFDDRVTAITLLLLCLASNFIQYAAVDGGLSHAWIFLLYVALLYATIKWHERAHAGWSMLTGYIIGIAMICRPTEAIALAIPLLWNTHTREAATAKWRQVRTHRLHVLYAIVGGILGILPQLLYWKSVTGSFIYDVGSKWMFLNPWFRVLFGWEKGWFIYTPVTIFFVLGLLFMKRYPFYKSVLVFCLLNIWIVIAWEDWRYGGSYSTRALVQSYPVFALALGSFVERIQWKKWRIAFYVPCIYLVGVNLFQIVQYNSTVLHYNDMNRRYYSRIYLNPAPDPIDMSLLDTDDWLSNEAGYSAKQLVLTAQPIAVHSDANTPTHLVDVGLPDNGSAERWLKIEAHLVAHEGLWKSVLTAELHYSDTTKRASIRLDNPVGKKTGHYAMYLKLPQKPGHGKLVIFLSTAARLDGTVDRLKVTELTRSTTGQ